MVRSQGARAACARADGRGCASRAAARSVLAARGVVRAGAGLRLAATLVGTVVGAGFVSGAELVRFFPHEGFLPCLAVAAGVFALCFFALCRLGAAYGGWQGVLRARFGRAAGAVRLFMLACSFAVTAAMLAGFDAVAADGFGVRLPLSLLLLPLLYALSRRGVKGLAALNLALVPCMLAFFASALPALAVTPLAAPADAFSALGGALLYAGMNAFLAAPVACDAGAAGGGCGGCFAAAAVIGVCAAAVLAAVAREGANALGAELPFLAAVGKTQALARAFSLVSACGIVTTLFSSYYPLHAAAAKRARAVRFAVPAAAFALSRWGMGGIVGAVYPWLGGAGLLFFAVLAAGEGARLVRAAREKGAPHAAGRP